MSPAVEGSFFPMAVAARITATLMTTLISIRIERFPVERPNPGALHGPTAE